ncbi:NUDIX domain-containing protein [Ramlibacter tataouinensis]|uniref:NUDIX domain-containing protein n=1 Tax=Ramlibacter tataouinensis TaxID=94132 RepID=UPI0022F3A1F4|nr:NUDIX domain-containing protein [Ramlibacter tataouinensis]WBY01719.1 NUDIX domain-containing protein [Ramlibacter tataouinensis]
MTRSAGLLMFRRTGDGLQVLLAHPGGPFWARKDDGAWTLPKGEVDDGEDAFATALREFEEETGCAPAGPFVDLGEVRQKSGKRVQAWAFEGDFDPATLRCNLFELEWPPRSGRRQQFPEVDRAGWFAMPDARRKLLPAQHPFLDRLAQHRPGDGR